MKITMSDEDLKVTVINKTLVSLNEVVQELVRPALIGMGYHPNQVDLYLNTEYSQERMDEDGD